MSGLPFNFSTKKNNHNINNQIMSRKKKKHFKIQNKTMLKHP